MSRVHVGAGLAPPGAYCPRPLRSCGDQVKLLDDLVGRYLVLIVVAYRLPHQSSICIDHVDSGVRKLGVEIVEPVPLAWHGRRHVIGERELDTHGVDRLRRGAQVLGGNGDDLGVAGPDRLVATLQLAELPAAESSPPGAEENDDDVLLSQVVAERHGLAAGRWQPEVRRKVSDSGRPDGC